MPESPIPQISADEKFTEMATRQQLINPFDAETSALKSRAPAQLLSHETVRLSRLNSFNSLFRQAAPIYHAAIKTGNMKVAGSVAQSIETAAKAVGTMILLLAILAGSARAQMTLPYATADPGLSEDLNYLANQIGTIKREFVSQSSGTVFNPNITLQGNSFNGASQLLQANGSSQYPGNDGSLITNIAGAHITGNISGSAGSLTGTVAVGNGGTGAITAPQALINLGAQPLLVGISSQCQPGYYLSSATWVNGVAVGGGCLSAAANVTVSTSATGIAWLNQSFLASVNGSNAVFTLSSTPSGAQAIQLVLDGLTLYNPADYTYTPPTTITMTTAPAIGTLSFFANYNVNTSTNPLAFILNSTQTASGSTTFTGPITMSNSTFTLTGQYGTIIGVSSITAGAFFGDGSHLSGVAASGGGGSTGTLTVGWQNDNFINLANGITTAFTLSQTPSSTAAIACILDGLHLGASDYTYTSPTTITMTTAPALGASGWFCYYTVNTTTNPIAFILNSTQSVSGTTTFLAPVFGVSGATETTTAALLGVGTGANPLGVNSSSVAVLGSTGFVLNNQLDPSSVTKQGFIPFNAYVGTVTAVISTLGSSTNTIAVNLAATSASTQTLATNVALATTTINLNVTASTNALSASTVTLAGVVSALGVSTNTISLSTASIYSALNSTASALTVESLLLAASTTTLSASTVTLTGWINSTGTALTIETANRIAMGATIGASTQTLSVNVAASTTTLFSVRASSGTNADITKFLGTATSGVTFSTYVVFAASFSAPNSTFTLTGQYGTIIGVSSITAGAFFGDGSHLSGVAASGGGASTAPVTWQNDNLISLANGVTKNFTTSQTPTSTAAVECILDGLEMGTSDYTFTMPNLIAMTTAPALGSSGFWCRYTVNTSTIPAAFILNSTQTVSGLTTFAGGVVFSSGVSGVGLSFASGTFTNGITVGSITVIGAGGEIISYGLVAGTATFTSTATVLGNAFSVGVTTLNVVGGTVYIGTTTVTPFPPRFEVYTSSMAVIISTQGAFDVSGGTYPTLSGCGAGPTITAGSNCERGSLTMGSGAASGGCVLGFPAVCFAKTPFCQMSGGGQGSLLAIGQTANSTIACDTVTTGVAAACGTSTFVTWNCFGN